MNLTIKVKLTLTVVLVLFGLAGVFLENSMSQNELSLLNSAQSELKEVQIAMLQLRRAEKDFLLHKDIKYKKSFAKTVGKAKILMPALIKDLNTADISLGKLPTIANKFIDYQKVFNQLIDASVEKGLNKNAGNYGRLRAATHALEELITSDNDFESQVLLLTLRRHEKDFMLRNDEKYIGKINDVAEVLANRFGDVEHKQLLAAYTSEIDEFVNMTKRIGLDSKSGMRGEMRSAVHEVEDLLKKEILRLNSYMNERVSSNKASSLVITIVISLFVVASVIVVSRQIITPLNVFTQRITEIREGNDLSQRTEERKDEIGHISHEFNMFMAHFQSLIKSINQTVDNLTQSTLIVSDSVARTSEGLNNQAVESDMVATAVNEMGITASEIANNAHSTKDKTDEATLKSGVGKEKLDATITNINNLSKELIGAGDEIIALQEKSNGITAVLEVIKSIADQTNLLALNAAIEAARAGEQGRGFAVVADEVRTLAVRTQDATSEISSIINELQSTTSGIVTTVNQCKEQGIESVNQAKETEQVLNEIVSDVNAISDMTVQVATAVEEQSAVIQYVDKNIVRIRDIGEQVATDSQENAKASQDVAQLAKDLHKEANIFKI